MAREAREASGLTGRSQHSQGHVTLLQGRWSCKSWGLDWPLHPCKTWTSALDEGWSQRLLPVLLGQLQISLGRPGWSPLKGQPPINPEQVALPANPWLVTRARPGGDSGALTKAGPSHLSLAPAGPSWPSQRHHRADLSRAAWCSVPGCCRGCPSLESPPVQGPPTCPRAMEKAALAGVQQSWGWVLLGGWGGGKQKTAKA